MAQQVLYGTDASITTSSYGCKFNAFSLSITQGYAEAVGFGDTWVSRKGTMLSGSGSIGGFLTKGTANDVPGIAAALTRAGVSTTLTFLTGCTMAFTAIYTGLNLGTIVTGNSNSGYDYVTTGAITETWATV